MDKHAQRIDIFNSTLDLIGQGWYMASDGSEVKLPPVGEVMAAARMYSEPFITIRSNVVFPSRYAFEPTEVRVENKDCVLAAKALIDAGYNPAMLNLADLYTPGGLVEYGSGAQEENLCRRSNLVQSLYQFSEGRVRKYPGLGLKPAEAQYPMDERFGGVYSGIVTFFRGPEDEGSMLEARPYNIPVISVAALNGPRIDDDGMMLQREVDITLDKMRTILRIGLANEHDSLVLSAFGCGAFANPPAHIAKLFHQVIEEDEFIDCYRLIDFAILDGYRTGLRHNPEGNYLPFLREFA